MTQILYYRYCLNSIFFIVFILSFVEFRCSFSTVIHIINESVFINPLTNTTQIQCPINEKYSSYIQWYDAIKEQHEVNKNRYYTIYGLKPFNRDVTCSSIWQENSDIFEKYQFKIRVYDRPLPIQNISIVNITSKSLTVQWQHNILNRNANITNYQLVLKENNVLQSRILLNSTSSNYTFSSLKPNTLYTIAISTIDQWKRSSTIKTITGKSLIEITIENDQFHKIIDRDLLDQIISCYALNRNLLLIEFDRSKFLASNFIYNLTIYDNEDHIILTDKLYSFNQTLPLFKTFNSFIYEINEQNKQFKIQLYLSTDQSKYLGSINKYCENFYPIFSPITCTVKPTDKSKFNLTMHTELYNKYRNIITLKPSSIFYKKNQNNISKKSIYTIDKSFSDTITDVSHNYSIFMEYNLINNDTNIKLNLSVQCLFNKLVPVSNFNRNSIIGIISLLFIILCSTILMVFIIFQKDRILSSRRRTYRHVYSFGKSNTRATSSRIRINRSINDDNIDSNDECSKEFESASIPLKQFESYVINMHKDNNLGFIRLFEDICEDSNARKFSSNISQNEHNILKNRYNNILSYDHSRVKLSGNEPDGKGTYINANYIDGYKQINAYIATQGPLTNTITDFWRMIWENDVRVLVMITNIQECGRVKCEVYWPENRTELYGNIEVTLVSETSRAYYVERLFSIRHTQNHKLLNNERFIHQFQYTDWPDHGVPIYTLPVLSFVRHSSACNSKHNGPIVVHCSAGVGRTGTYIVIDAMLKAINSQRSINITSFLKNIRRQRNYLVQTEEQFIFIYDVLLEAVKVMNIGYKDLELDENNYNNIIHNLHHCDEDSNLTNIEKQFQLITKEKLRSNSSLSNEQMKKYRTKTILSSDVSKVLVSVDGKKEYVNASYIHGYSHDKEFIVTQHPMVNTINDFWTLVWESNASIIVSLYAEEKSQKDVPDFWPLTDQTINCRYFEVQFVDESNQYEYIYRNILLRSLKKNIEKRVKIISNSFWPETCSSFKTAFNLINTVKHFSSNQPIIVHDHFGGHRAAIFCALYTMNDQIQTDGELNVYELAKFYHFKRPGIWRDQKDLMFLYQCAEKLFHEYRPSTGNQHYTSL